MENKLLLIGILTLVLAIPNVLAEGFGFSHSFWGDVTTNGFTAKDGVIVSAYVGDSFIKSSSVFGGRYGEVNSGSLYVQIGDPSNVRQGSLIEFYVKDESGTDILAGTHVLGFGDDYTTELDLSVTGDFTAPGTGSSSSGTGSSSSGSGGGSSSSGGGGSSSSSSSSSSGGSEESIVIETYTAEEETCVPNWQCSDWAACYRGEQSRICTDYNNCGIDEGKPTIMQICEYEVPEFSKPGERGLFASITGFVSGNTAGATAIGLIIVVAIIAGLFLARKGVKK